MPESVDLVSDLTPLREIMLLESAAQYHTGFPACLCECLVFLRSEAFQSERITCWNSADQNSVNEIER